MQWGYGADLTESTTVNFPIAFPNKCYALINVGFYISNAGRQVVDTITKTNFTTHSELRGAATNSYLALGN